MPSLFERNRPDINSIMRVKELIKKQFNLSDAYTISIAELRCHEHNCPPVETVITSHDVDGSSKNRRIPKPVKEVSVKDIDSLKKE